MQQPHKKRPRHLAVDLVDAWVSGQSPEPILAKMIEADRQLARAHARAHCMRIKFYANRGESPPDQIMKEWVEVFIRNRDS